LKSVPWSTYFYTARAWSVHLFTALGVVAALMTLIEMAQGNARMAAYWGFISCGIDSVDGTLARRFQVKKWAPEFDGRKLDDVIDYITYVFLPVFFVWRFELIPAGWLPALGLVLLASVYRFCEDSAKTNDGYFTGFPSYWNFLVLYFYLLRSPQWLNLVLLIFWAIMVFVPIKYIYPSHTRFLKPVTIGLTILTALVHLAIVILFEQSPLWLVLLGVSYWVYYMGLSFYLNLRRST
jgi:phosphatidylcholine synthase